MRTAQSNAFAWSSATRWALTVAATVLSAGALDVIATVSGGLLIASHVFADAAHELALAFLVATYIIWMAGLRLNLDANWHLLESTGTSTNALSKAAYDVVRIRLASRRTMRAASMVGYVGTELVKEAPFYAGAFGATLVSDSVDSTDALIFLGGANLGAALYEYGIARIVRLHLARRSRRGDRSEGLAAPVGTPYASFETDWSPQVYLADYYQVVEADERATIAFLVDALRLVEPDRPVLVFGVGPTMHHVFAAAETASEIHLAEYLPANLIEVERWLADDDAAHDWRPFVEYTLQCEGIAAPTSEQIRAREDLTRNKVTKLLHGDARRADPLAGSGQASYSTVISAYCADSATDDMATWEGYLRRIAGLVRPGGLFLTAALRKSTGYIVGERRFPSACVDEGDVRRVLAPDFDCDGGAIVAHELSANRAHGYASLVLARTRRTSPADDIVDVDTMLQLADAAS